MSFNKIVIVGNLGKDPELRYTPAGDAVCNISLATNEKRKDKEGEYQDVTTWFKVTLWRRMAENASKYLEKGSQVFIEGRLRVEEWTDRDGNNRWTLEVDGTDMQFLGGGARRDEGTTGRPQPRQSEFAGPPQGGAPQGGFQRPTLTDDDIPF